MVSTPPQALGDVSRTSALDDVAKIKWFHQIDLGNGIVTPGVDRSAAKLAELHLPPDMHGKTFLDIGAWDGFFSFEAERRGASRVLATDSFVWSGQTWGSKRGFETARAILGSKVEDLQIDVHDLSPESVGTFDIVLFAGVLYHLKHPMLALEKVAAVTKELLVLETATDLLSIRRPAMAFYPERELNGDDTNWCGPNIPCLLGMLRSCGFKRVEVKHQMSYLRRFGRAIRKLRVAELQRGRVVVHAQR